MTSCRQAGQMARKLALGATSIFAAAAAAGCIQLPIWQHASVPTPATLAEASATCFGYATRLTLVPSGSAHEGFDIGLVRNLGWLLEIAGPPRVSESEITRATIDAFTVRDAQGIRSDMALVQMGGTADHVLARGLVQVPNWPGGFREGDEARLQAWIQTPRGSFSTGTVGFYLRPGEDGAHGDRAYTSPAGGCLTS